MGSIPIFLIIDVVTAWPYAYGQVRLNGPGEAIGVRQPGPRDLPELHRTAYIVGAGSGEMPLFAWVVIGALIVVFGVASIIRILRQIRAPES